MRSANDRLSCFALALAFAAIGCRNDGIAKVQKPLAPSMQSLLDAYATPTASLEAASIVELATGIAQRMPTVDSLQLDQRVIDAAHAGLAQLQQQSGTATTIPALPQSLTEDSVSAARQALTLEGNGYLVVTRICDGWGTVPVPDYANGFMELTVGFTEQGVDPVVWGTLSLCKYKFGEHTIQLEGLAPDPRNGDVRIFVGRNVTTTSFGAFPDPLLVDLDAQVILDGTEVMGKLNFQIDVNTRALALLVPLSAGHVIVGLSADRTAVAQVRAANGTFGCDLTARRCSAPDGSQFGAP